MEVRLHNSLLLELCLTGTGTGTNQANEMLMCTQRELSNVAYLVALQRSNVTKQVCASVMTDDVP